MISRIHSTDVELTFRLQENVSVANALRRTILADIPTAVLFPCRITKNTSRFTNEILAQRIGCVPVHSLDPSVVGYELSLNAKNTSEEIIVVTTEDFVVEGHAKAARTLFPPSIYGDKEWFIDLLRLRPAVANIPGEEIALTCSVSVGKAKESGQYNVASTCSYAATHNQAASDEAFSKKEGESKENWNMLEAKRFIDPDSFDFIIQSVGVYKNHELIAKACEILIQSLHSIEFRIDPYNDRDVIFKKKDVEYDNLSSEELLERFSKQVKKEASN